MTGGTWSAMKSRSAKSCAIIDLGPTAPADQAKSMQISVTCYSLVGVHAANRRPVGITLRQSQ
jgi:hypothetical protein